MPTIFRDRCGISLYEAQYSTGKRGPIPPDVIQEVLAALLRFKITCQDFGVPGDQIRVIATEATREAINSVEYRQAIKDRTGWQVEMLPRAEEGRVGAMGVASSFPSIKGLVMDLGGGSVQLTWMISENGAVTTSPKGAVSLPYGAAAMGMKLAAAEQAGDAAKAQLRQELKTRFQQAYNDLEIPPELENHATAHGGFSLYLSGGGFRGWGYLLMSSHRINPYPIPIINGFRVDRLDFQNTVDIQALASKKKDTFRVSDRRANQVPAVAFLVTVLTESLPAIKEAHFCQGGVREGILYQSLPPSIQALHPLETATSLYTPPSSQILTFLLQSAIPPLPIPHHQKPPPEQHIQHLTSLPFLHALTSLLNHHSPLPKESRPVAALRCTTSGLLAGVHGISHDDRALLALVLCERWGAQLSPTDAGYLQRMQALVGDEATWWCRYVGRVAAVVGGVWPAGVVDGTQQRLELLGRWREGGNGSGKRSRIELVLRVREGDNMTADEGIAGSVKALEKVGKRKNWVGGGGGGEGKDGFGFKVDVLVKRDL